MRRARTVLALLGGVALGAVASAVGRLLGFDLPWPVTLAAGLVAGLLVACAWSLPAADPVPAGTGSPARSGASASFGDLGALRFAVEMDSRDPDRFETRLRPRLTALAVELLWQRHRLDWRTETGRAAALPLLGPDLTALLTAPPHTLRPTPNTLTRWTRALEAL